MKVILGLGNPGPQYADTRHNIGFMLIDRLRRTRTGPPPSEMPRDHWFVGYQAQMHGQQVLLVKPQTYMNRSGIAAQAILRLYQMSPEQMIVVYDDLDLEVGRLRIRKKGGHGGHKGIKSCMEWVGTSDFVRMRLGIGRPEPDTPATPEDAGRNQIVEYVLQPFQQDELPVIHEVLERAVEAIQLIVADQIETAMNQYNRS
jgi:peptidyl-tRNA hydrolase, PTH1 family